MQLCFQNLHNILNGVFQNEVMCTKSDLSCFLLFGASGQFIALFARSVIWHYSLGEKNIVIEE